jgi:hypothetical protein
LSRRSSLSGRGIASLSVPVNAYISVGSLYPGGMIEEAKRTLPAAEKVPIAVPIAAQAPNASGRDLALTPAMNPAAHPPAAAFNASSVCSSVLDVD